MCIMVGVSDSLSPPPPPPPPSLPPLPLTRKFEYLETDLFVVSDYFKSYVLIAFLDFIEKMRLL